MISSWKLCEKGLECEGCTRISLFCLLAALGHAASRMTSIKLCMDENKNDSFIEFTLIPE
ncbi:hypothetical protein HQN88_30460 [Paenibacillus qinlingensis]|nr:hypothetical protein [Paenibacillus qinlingensis]